tara:strand:- start:3579 stop:5291 length:1713 start_codon:yes stop_codon:yes gene_type:complete
MGLIAVEMKPIPAAGPRELALSEEAKRLAGVQTAVVERRFADVETRMVGKIAIDETRLRDITARVPGRIDRLYVDYTGVHIHRGDHMVSIYSPELLTAQEELVQALRALEKLEDRSVSSLKQTAALTVESARQKLRLWGLTPEQIRRIETERAPSDHLTIYAPESGVVVKRYIGQGAYVQTGERIYTTADLSNLWLKLEVYESDLPWIQYGQSVEFRVEALPGERFEGRISFINPLLDEKTRTIGVRVNVKNVDGRLKPGMLVRAVVRSQTTANGSLANASLAGKWISPMHPEIVKEQAGLCDVCGMALVPADSLGYVGLPSDSLEAPLLVPASVPLLTGKRAIVYVAISGKAGRYEGREVELGPRAGDYYIVRSGLRAGERVVLHGAFKIDSALQIKAQPSMMSAVEVEENVAARTASFEEAPLKDLLLAYLVVQKGLSSDHLQMAMNGAQTLRSALLRSAHRGSSDVLRNDWERMAPALEQALDLFAAAPDIASARAAFVSLSETVLGSVERLGLEMESALGIYHCPMALKDRGARWIQRVGAVENPYFGASMLRCGSLQRALVARGE